MTRWWLRLAPGLALVLTMCGPAPAALSPVPPAPALAQTPAGDTPSAEPPASPSAAATATRQVFLPLITQSAPPVTIPPTGSLSLGAPLANRASVPLYDKFELAFTVAGSAATRPDFPYDPAPPPGLPGRVGITVEGLFLPPGVTDWAQARRVPAFRYQAYERLTIGEGEGLYPAGAPGWRVRFAPTAAGVWRYKVRAQDATLCPAGVVPCSAWVETASGSFTATAARSGVHGFLRVSPTDTRYFEFSDGTPFLGLGHQIAFADHTRVETLFDTFQANGVTLLRAWLGATGVYGLGFWFWDTWANSSLVFTPAAPGKDVSARIVGAGDSPCIFEGFGEGAKAALKGGVTYQLLIRARLEGVTGPRVAGQPFGLAAKLGAWPKGICGNPANGLRSLSPYWSGTRDWTEYTATFTLPEDVVLGTSDFFTLALENVTGGTAYIDEVRVTAAPGGPNLLVRGDMNYHLYMDPAAAWRWDTILDRAAERGVFLKLVASEKQDGILSYIQPDGTVAADPSDDNFYAIDPLDGSRPTKSRRLQEYYWRYLSARWGYSTAVHSWELLNEGDPFDVYHYQAAEAFGRSIHTYDPNRHLVTTSFWHSFPNETFWANAAYPNVDYADFHAYSDTTWLNAPDDIRDPAVRARCGSNQNCYLSAMLDDSALFHLEHSLNAWARSPGKPIVRGEAALTVLGSGGQESDPALLGDLNGVWLHKFLFAQAGPGGLTDIYWYTDEITANRLYPVYRRFSAFMAGIPFNSGAFVDAAPVVSGAGLRALGQKDPAGRRAYLWIDNANHTWRNTVTHRAIAPVSGTITVTGFLPGATVPVAWWETCSGQAPGACTAGVQRQTTAVADARGAVTLTITNLATDTAVKLGTFPVP
ncbi:MAG: hypothetical protein JNK29_12115 [Anaerolineales bacterium]|nr:hypothetical protein [Anaerolineales bacterium]